MENADLPFFTILTLKVLALNFPEGRVVARLTPPPPLLQKGESHAGLFFRFISNFFFFSFCKFFTIFVFGVYFLLSFFVYFLLFILFLDMLFRVFIIFFFNISVRIFALFLKLEGYTFPKILYIFFPYSVFYFCLGFIITFFY